MVTLTWLLILIAVWVWIRSIGVSGFIVGRDTCLQELGRSTLSLIGFFVFIVGLLVCFFGLAVNRFPFIPVSHKLSLSGLFIFLLMFSSVSFPPSDIKIKDGKDIRCPANYAITYGNGDYIRCEDFNQFFIALKNGVILNDLIIRK